MSDALTKMFEENPNAFIGIDASTGFAIMIEDVRDPDGRWFRMEIQSTIDGLHAAAFCRYSPWGPFPAAEYLVGHAAPSGFLCLGPSHASERVEDSSYEIISVIRRAHYWCTAYSVFRETGTFPQP